MKPLSTILILSAAACSVAPVGSSDPQDEAPEAIAKTAPPPAQTPASAVTYSNTTSKLTATNVQAALDEIVAKLAAPPPPPPPSAPTGGAHAIYEGWQNVGTAALVSVTVDAPGTYMVHAKLGAGSGAPNQESRQAQCYVAHPSEAFGNYDVTAASTVPYTATPMNLLAEVTVTSLDGTDNRIDLMCQDLFGDGFVKAYNAQLFAIHYR